MKEIALSIDEMKHLQKLGVDTSNASMYWSFSQSHLSLVSEQGNLKAFEKRSLGIGAFTLQDILNIIPPRLNKKYQLILCKVGDKWEAEYSYSKCENTLHSSCCGTTLETAYEMLAWVVENQYLPKKFLK